MGSYAAVRHATLSLNRQIRAGIDTRQESIVHVLRPGGLLVMTEPVPDPPLRRNRWARISRISSKSADANGCVTIFRSEIEACRYMIISKDRQGWGDAKGALPIARSPIRRRTMKGHTTHVDVISHRVYLKDLRCVSTKGLQPTEWRGLYVHYTSASAQRGCGNNHHPSFPSRRSVQEDPLDPVDPSSFNWHKCITLAPFMCMTS